MTKITASYDIASDNDESVWVIFSRIFESLGVDCGMIANVHHKGYGPSGWPILEITFNNLDTARAFTAVYLELDDDSKEVDEYLGVKVLSPVARAVSAAVKEISPAPGDKIASVAADHLTPKTFDGDRIVDQLLGAADELLTAND